jgi:hypothetical protein
MIEIEITGDQYPICGPKCLLMLTKAQFIAALRAGKRFKRREAFQAQLAAVTDRTKGEKSRGQQCET